MKKAAQTILAIFGLLTFKAIAAWLLPILIGKLICLLITYPALTINTIITYVYSRHSGKSEEEAAKDAKIDFAIASAVELVFKWLSGLNISFK